MNPQWRVACRNTIRARISMRNCEQAGSCPNLRRRRKWVTGCGNRQNPGVDNMAIRWAAPSSFVVPVAGRWPVFLKSTVPALSPAHIGSLFHLLESVLWTTASNLSKFNSGSEIACSLKYHYDFKVNGNHLVQVWSEMYSASTRRFSFKISCEVVLRPLFFCEPMMY